jgi:hypothetical protein
MSPGAKLDDASECSSPPGFSHGLNRLAWVLAGADPAGGGSRDGDEPLPPARLVLHFVNTQTYYACGFARCRHARSVPRISPFHIELTAQEREELECRAVKYTLPYYQVLRARMVLYAAQGFANDDIARCLDTRREVVSQWRKRFFEERLPGLEERPRPGRPRSFPPRTGRAG